jgi:hypothetical protein
MGERGAAPLLPELSKFYCFPGRAGELPWLLGLNLI